MAFRDFAFPQVIDDLGLTLGDARLFAGVRPIRCASSAELVPEGMELAVFSGTEKAKSEFIIALVMLEWVHVAAGSLHLFSGVEWNPDPSARPERVLRLHPVPRPERPRPERPVRGRRRGQERHHQHRPRPVHRGRVRGPVEQRAGRPAGPRRPRRRLDRDDVAVPPVRRQCRHDRPDGVFDPRTAANRGHPQGHRRRGLTAGSRRIAQRPHPPARNDRAAAGRPFFASPCRPASWVRRTADGGPARDGDFALRNARPAARPPSEPRPRGSGPRPRLRQISRRPAASLRRPEVRPEVLRHPRPVPLHHHRVRHHVRQARQRQHLEVLARPEQRVGQLQRVPEVDVVVGRAVDQQQRPFQVRRQREQRRLLVGRLRSSGGRPR